MYRGTLDNVIGILHAKDLFDLTDQEEKNFRVNNPNDIIDDRIDVVSRGTLGLTVACARCHDHKFDPIPTKDYYSLHGIFASSEEPAEKPLLTELRDSADYQDYLKQKAKIQNEIVEFTAKEVAKFIGELRDHVGDYMLGARDAALLPEQSKFETFAGERKLNPKVLRRWMSDLEARSKKTDPIFGPWFELAKLPEAGFATNAKSVLARLAGFTNAENGSCKGAVTQSEGKGAGPGSSSTWPVVNPNVAKALLEHATNSLKEVSEAYNKLFSDVDVDWKAALEAADKDHKAPPTKLADLDREALRQVLYAEGTAVNVPKAEAEAILARPLSDKTAPIRNKIEALSWTHAGAPRRAMVMVDRGNPSNSRVFKRGSPGNPGEEAPRRFLEILSQPERPPFTNGSGRLQLARAIASRDNPLTSRVYANRVWLHHFGEGLINTPGDFGVRTEQPVHQTLLDYLAASFVENGWSTKSLHRLILLSSTYQQSSDASVANLKADPDNRLLTRMNRQRLDFEAVRDTLLAVAGQLDTSLGGIPVDLEREPFTKRRTIYGLIDRQNLPAVFRTFDFANPDTSSQGRFHTTVPQQALFLMNSSFVIEQARALAQRTEVKSGANLEERIQALHHLVLQRQAARDEVQLAQKFIAGQPQTAAKLSPLEKYAQILVLSNEVMFVD